jgi:hypothetical protein
MQINFKGLIVRLSIKLLFAFLVALQGDFVFAQPVNQNELSNSENTYFSEEQSYTSVSEQFAITWPVLPGESVKDIAALFYPKNKIMQQYFIDKTLQLSLEINPNLHPNTTYNHASMIVVPNIKFLGRRSGNFKAVFLKKKNIDSQLKPKLRQSNILKDDASFDFSRKIQAIYDGLVKRNIQFKLDLEKLNSKLANLQQSLLILKDDLIRIIDLAFSIADNKNKVIKQPQETSVSNGALMKELAKNRPSEFTSEDWSGSRPVKVKALPLISAESVFRYLLLPIVGLFLVIGLGLYVQRQLKNFHPLISDNLNSIEKKVFVNNEEVVSQPISIVHGVEDSLKDVAFSGSIPGMDLEDGNYLEQQKEANLVLEQAKIYTSMNRLKEAVMLLKTQIQETPKVALHHWFYLLEICRMTNQKEAFLNNARQLHEKFNIMPPQWEKSKFPPLVASSLEELPHIIERLTKLWTVEGKATENLVQTKAYLDELLMDNRSTERMGFGLEVFQEIMLLRDMLDTRFKLALEN